MSNRTPNGEAIRYYREVVLTYEGDDCLIWPYYRCKKGYGKVAYNGRFTNVSRLACIEANGPPPTPQHEAAHSCGNGYGGCVAKGHMSWKTPKENSADRFVHGTVLRGDTSPTAKLTESQAREILLLNGKMSKRNIARLFGISRSHVLKIHGGQNWKHLRAAGDQR